MLLRPPAIETCTIVFGSEQTFPITRTIVSAAAALSSGVRMSSSSRPSASVTTVTQDSSKRILPTSP